MRISRCIPLLGMLLSTATGAGCSMLIRVVEADKDFPAWECEKLDLEATFKVAAPDGIIETRKTKMGLRTLDTTKHARLAGKSMCFANVSLHDAPRQPPVIEKIEVFSAQEGRSHVCQKATEDSAEDARDLHGGATRFGFWTRCDDSMGMPPGPAVGPIPALEPRPIAPQKPARTLPLRFGNEAGNGSVPESVRVRVLVGLTVVVDFHSVRNNAEIPLPDGATRVDACLEREDEGRFRMSAAEMPKKCHSKVLTQTDAEFVIWFESLTRARVCVTDKDNTPLDRVTIACPLEGFSCETEKDGCCGSDAVLDCKRVLVSREGYSLAPLDEGWPPSGTVRMKDDWGSFPAKVALEPGGRLLPSEPPLLEVEYLACSQGAKTCIQPLEGSLQMLRRSGNDVSIRLTQNAARTYDLVRVVTTGESRLPSVKDGKIVLSYKHLDPTSKLTFYLKTRCAERTYSASVRFATSPRQRDLVPAKQVTVHIEARPGHEQDVDPRGMSFLLKKDSFPMPLTSTMCHKEPTLEIQDDGTYLAQTITLSKDPQKADASLFDLSRASIRGPAVFLMINAADLSVARYFEDLADVLPAVLTETKPDPARLQVVMVEGVNDYRPVLEPAQGQIGIEKVSERLTAWLKGYRLPNSSVFDPVRDLERAARATEESQSGTPRKVIYVVPSQRSLGLVRRQPLDDRKDIELWVIEIGKPSGPHLGEGLTTSSQYRFVEDAREAASKIEEAMKW